MHSADLDAAKALLAPQGARWLCGAALAWLSLAQPLGAGEEPGRPASLREAGYSRLLLGGFSQAGTRTAAAAQEPEPPQPEPRPGPPAPPEAGEDDWSRPALGRWAFDAGVAVISENSTLELFRGGANAADGDAGGQIYNLYATRLLKEFSFDWGGRTMRPHWEFRGGLGVVDQNGGDPFLDYMVDMTLRWRDFPWNRHVDTTLGVGGGFFFSDKVLAIDRERHQGDYRSHFKFFMPVELTLACPKYPRLQCVLFNHHASGGHIFDDGGFDTWGGGLRFWLP